MPIPCSSFSPNSANLAVGLPALQKIDAPPAGDSALAGAGAKSFGSLLAKVDDPSAKADADQDEGSATSDQTKDHGTEPALTAEQMGLLASLMATNPALAPPPPPAPESLDKASSLKLLGAEGKSIPALLVNGTTVLEYNVAPAAPDTLAPAPLETPTPASLAGQSTLPGGRVRPPGSRPSASPSLGQPNVQPPAPLAPAALDPSERSAAAALGQAQVGNAAVEQASSAISGAANLPFKSGAIWGTRPFRMTDRPAASLSTNPSSASADTAAPAPSTLSLPAGAPSPAPAPLPLLSPGAAPTPTVTASTKSDPSSSDATPGSTVDTPQGTAPTVEATPAAATLTNAAASSAAQHLGATSMRSKNTPGPRQEKSAGALSGIRSAGDKSSNVRGKNIGLTVDDKPLDKASDELGTVAANWGKTMDLTARNFPPASSASDPSGLGGMGRSGTGTTSDSPTTVTPAHASDLVHEIREIADGLWAVERNSVEVKFNFSEHERLSVKVEYRDGTVQATFRSDSADVRDAIAREWQAQSGTADQRPYRVAEPVFTGAPASSDFSLGGDASRQQRSPDQPPQAPSSDRSFSTPASRGTPLSVASPLAAPTSPRELSAGRLQAFV